MHQLLQCAMQATAGMYPKFEPLDTELMPADIPKGCTLRSSPAGRLGNLVWALLADVMPRLYMSQNYALSPKCLAAGIQKCWHCTS